MRKYNGPEIERLLLSSHLRMANWEALDKLRTPNILIDNISILLAVGLLLLCTIK